MANTYTQIHIHAVFVVRHRDCVIHADWKDRLYRYITGIIQKHEHKLLAINGMPDHIHILFGHRPSQSLSELLQDVKSGSSKWINENKLVKGKFSWQEGYGAFSHSKSVVPNVIHYIQNQEIHHQRLSFTEEHRTLLDEEGVDYDTRYLFKEVL